MTELNPPSWLQDGCYTAQNDRSVTANLVCAEGVSRGLGATASGLDRVVVISEGGAFIEGDNAPGQGMYSVSNVGTAGVVIPASSSGDPREDLIVARVYDSQYIGGQDEWVLEVVQGTPSPTPMPPALPLNAIPLWVVRVPTGSTFVTNADLTDARSPYEACSTPALTSLTQAGRATFTTTYATVQSSTITFATPFTSIPRVVTTANTTSPQGLNVAVQGISATGFTLSAYRYASGSNTSTFEWIAFGSV